MSLLAAKIGGIVLCGGESRRMGRSKAWLEWDGEYLLQRVARLAREAIGPVVVAHRAEYDLPPLPPDVEIVLDAVEQHGPLAGIAAGFDSLADRCEAAFVVACDHPLLRPRFVGRLIELLDEHQAVVPWHEGRLHPLAALYRLATRETLAGLLQTQTLRATTFGERCSARVVRAENFADCDPELDSLCSFNDLEGYRALLRRLRTEG